MKVGLAIVGAFITDESMIYRAMNSGDMNFSFDEHLILIDGCPPNKSEEDKGKYRKYVENLNIISSTDYELINFDTNIYFKSMIGLITNFLDIDYWLIIQDDVVLDDLNIEEILEDMIRLDANIISFPHKKIEKSTHWFNLIEDSECGKYQKCHGWSERTFLFRTESFKKLIKKEKGGKNVNNFIDTIYNKKMKTIKWKKSSEEDKMDYWENWKCYISKDILHKHLVGKRKN